MTPGPLPDYPFRRAAHDRLAERRTDHKFLDRTWRDAATRVLVVRDGELACNQSADQLRFVSPAEAPSGERVLLGRARDTVCFAMISANDLEVGFHSQAGSFATLRRLATRLDDEAASLAVHAVAVAGWHRRHQRCAQCGSLTTVADAGAFRRCHTCSTEHYPRTDPAVIMLVTDAADRCLLGHNAARPAGWFSTLAGFVEPGETPEQAVAREVREEVGVEVGDVWYAGSQPWPFPSSLMLGYFAQAKTTSVTVDGTEISAARWFGRDELARAVRSGDVGLPTTLSIAGALLTAWYGAELPANVLEM